MQDIFFMYRIPVITFQITQLKIDHNPFAKGFRDTGNGRREKRYNCSCLFIAFHNIVKFRTISYYRGMNFAWLHLIRLKERVIKNSRTCLIKIIRLFALTFFSQCSVFENDLIQKTAGSAIDAFIWGAAEKRKWDVRRFLGRTSVL